MAEMNHTKVPYLSIDTLDGNSGVSGPRLEISSRATLEVDGAIDQTALTSKFISKQTTGSYTSVTLADGELTIGSVSATSCRLVFRSGNTTYEFWANRATTL